MLEIIRHYPYLYLCHLISVSLFPSGILAIHRLVHFVLSYSFWMLCSVFIVYCLFSFSLDDFKFTSSSLGPVKSADEPVNDNPANLLLCFSFLSASLDFLSYISHYLC